MSDNSKVLKLGKNMKKNVFLFVEDRSEDPPLIFDMEAIATNVFREVFSGQDISPEDVEWYLYSVPSEIYRLSLTWKDGKFVSEGSFRFIPFLSIVYGYVLPQSFPRIVTRLDGIEDGALTIEQFSDKNLRNSKEAVAFGRLQAYGVSMPIRMLLEENRDGKIVLSDKRYVIKDVSFFWGVPIYVLSCRTAFNNLPQFHITFEKDFSEVLELIHMFASTCPRLAFELFGPSPRALKIFREKAGLCPHTAARRAYKKFPYLQITQEKLSKWEEETSFIFPEWKELEALAILYKCRPEDLVYGPKQEMEMMFLPGEISVSPDGKIRWH